MESALRALADGRRRQILRLVWGTEMTAGEVAAHFPVSRPAISQHLQVLKEAGLVLERRDGTRRHYRGRPAGMAEVRAFVDQLRDDRLASLRRVAEAEERRRSAGPR